MKQARVWLWIIVALAAAMFAFLTLELQRPDRGVALGAPFELQTAAGEPFRFEDMQGSPHLIFFGFTHCPEVCPTTLYEISGWLDTLGSEADDLKAYFITVDPERDTPQVLDNYLSPFPRVTGLTGSLEEMDKAAKGFHVYYKKVPLDEGGYTMDHTASVFLIRADGSFLGTIAYSENPDTAIEKLRRLLSAS
ncbi:MAG: SCO family protein [Nitratireductor sp.]|nr:SCO family protein [Nitratireductor sp.]